MNNRNGARVRKEAKPACRGQIKYEEKGRTNSANDDEYIYQVEALKTLEKRFPNTTKQELAMWVFWALVDENAGLTAYEGKPILLKDVLHKFSADNERCCLKWLIGELKNRRLWLEQPETKKNEYAALPDPESAFYEDTAIQQFDLNRSVDDCPNEKDKERDTFSVILTEAQKVAFPQKLNPATYFLGRQPSALKEGQAEDDPSRWDFPIVNLFFRKSDIDEFQPTHRWLTYTQMFEKLRGRGHSDNELHELIRIKLKNEYKHDNSSAFNLWQGFINSLYMDDKTYPPLEVCMFDANFLGEILNDLPSSADAQDGIKIKERELTI